MDIDDLDSIARYILDRKEEEPTLEIQGDTMKPTQTIKIWKSTLRNLRLLHAVQEESMTKILDRLISQESDKYEVKLKKETE